MTASKTATPALASSDPESDSDEVYIGARRHILTKKQKQRQLQVAAGLAPPSQSHTRFSGRARTTANYNEDQDEEEFEMDEMTPNYGATDPNTPALPKIHLVLDHRLCEGTTFGKDDIGKRDFEYLIKWEDTAHYHATWYTLEALKGYRIGKVDNYFKKVVMVDIYYHTASDADLEEKEKWLIDREQAADALKEYQQIEKIIGSQRGEEEEIEYLVKWKGLTYDFCTWEDQSLVSKLDMEQVDKFLARSQNLPHSDRLPSGRGQYRPFKEQPSYIKHGQLREFQIKGVNFLARNWCQSNNVMLADEMGLGKTVQTIAFLNWLRHEKTQQGPFLVVVPLSTMPAWQETFDNWTPDLNYVVYSGNEKARNIIREHEMLVDGDFRRTKFHALLISYEFINIDFSFLSQIKWQFLGIDEAHRLKNQDSKLYGQLAAMKTGSRLLITGTPMQNNIGELKSLMDFLMPGKVRIDEDIDLSSALAQQQIAQLTDEIRPYMMRRTKALVESDLPPKTEKIMRVELSDRQLEIYRNILTRNVEELNKGVAKGQKNSLLNIMMELKKASNHPYMFPNVEEDLLKGSEEKSDILRNMVTSSGKMMLLEKLLDKLKKDGHRVLIFSQMVRMLDLLSDYLNLRRYKFQRLDGTMASGARRHAIDHFNVDDSDDFCFILSTRAGGLGINLMTADTVIIFDSDWNPQADLQAMARAHRIGQKKPVTIYRFVSKDTVEEEILERARNKLILEHLTIQRGITDQQKDQLVKKGLHADMPTSNEEIDRILKSRSQKMFLQKGNQEKLESLDIDTMLEEAEEHKTDAPEGLTADGGEDFLKSFEYTDVKVDLEWDDIIPKEHLEAFRAQEQAKRDEEMAARLAEVKPTRQRKQTVSDEREQRAAKKKAREAAKAAAADVDQSDDSDNDPRRPLSESENRRLHVAYLQYGDLDDMEAQIVAKAKLTDRDPAFLGQVLDEIIAVAKRALDEKMQQFAEQEKKTGKALTKKDKSEPLFDFKGIKKLNARTTVERGSEMRMLRELISKEPDKTRFRIPEAAKPAKDFTCEWGAREDGMLMVGIVKHGWGSWSAIRDDPELRMQDKCFLEEQRKDQKEARAKGENINPNKPTQVHLNRRAGYLVSVLRDKLSNGTDPVARKAMENHHRNVKKLLNQQSLNGASPRVRNRGASHSEVRQSIDRRTGTPDIRRKPTDDGDRKKRSRADEADRNHKRHKLSNGGELKRHHGDDGDREHKRRRPSDEVGGSPAARRGDGSRREHDLHKSSSKRDSSRHRSPEDRKSQMKHGDSRHRSPDDRKSLAHRPDPHRHHSGDRPVEKTSRPVDKAARPAEKPKVERDGESDRVLSKLLEPVSGHLELIPKLAADKQNKLGDTESKRAKIETSLLAIGAFIEGQHLGQDDERKKLWDYFGHKCFKGLAAEKIKTIYTKRAAAAKQSSGTSSRSNGHANGENQPGAKPAAIAA